MPNCRFNADAKTDQSPRLMFQRFQPEKSCLERVIDSPSAMGDWRRIGVLEWPDGQKAVPERHQRRRVAFRGLRDAHGAQGRRVFCFGELGHQSITRSKR